MISTPGVGSGIDIRSIITQLMAIERAPLVRLGTEQVALAAQVSAFGKLKSDVALFRGAMNELSDTAKFRYFKAQSSDDKIFTASASSTAAKGTYSIAVTRIAESHRLAASTVFADNNTTLIGAAGDTMSITVGTKNFSVNIGEKTLNQIRDAINGAANNAGVTASILNDDAGFHLTLVADGTGSTNAMQTAFSNLAAPGTPIPGPFALQTLNADRDGSGTFTNADLDLRLVIDGAFTVTRPSNTLSDIIDGVTLDLASAGTATLTLSRDDAKIAGSVQQLVGVYNQVMKTLGELRGSVLASERGALRSFESQFRNILNTKAGDGSLFSFASELGITTGRDSRLSLNTAVFNKALQTDPNGVADLFANDNSGLATRFEALAANLIDAGGALDSREQSLKSRIDRISTARSNMAFRLTAKEATLVQQYSALDALVASLNTTSGFLTTQFARLSANGNRQ